MDNPVRYEQQDGIAVITIDNAPVNALSQPVRAGLQSAFEQFASDNDARIAVLVGAGRIFIGGADISEFGKPRTEPHVPGLVNAMEASAKPIVSAIHGAALGGGLEVALATHYRLALKGAQIGLTEVRLGLIPGAGGSQRLPRLTGIPAALEMIPSGRILDASEALDKGIVDRVVEGTDARAEGLAYAAELLEANAPARAVGELPCPEYVAADFEAARARLAKSARGEVAPLAAVDAIEFATRTDTIDGMVEERRIFGELMGTPQRAGLIHAFFTERKIAKVPEIVGVKPRKVETVGVVGGGTMGAGIACSVLLSGLSVTLVERDEASADKARGTISHTLGGAVTRGKLSESERTAILTSRLLTAATYDALADCDLIIEAVFEDMEVKKQVFTQLDRVAKPGAVIASNTSYLDLNQIADFTARPQDVIGLHFFSPAHVMRLLEIVVGDRTGADVTATGFALAKRLGKIAVRAGVCDGFIGNRILAHYRKALDYAVLAGASPFDVDRALTGFGLAMGPYAVGDLAGLDIGWANRKRLSNTRDPREVYVEFSDRLCQAGNFGRKTGKGFYIYGEGAPQPNEEVLDFIAEERRDKGINPRPMNDDAILARYIAAMVNEAAKVIEEGIARRPMDVDATLLNGYGFPRWRGGPMHTADTIGLEKILNDIRELSQEDAFFWQAAPLLERLVAEGKTFSSLND